MNPILFSIGNFQVRWYSIFILIGACLAYLFSSKEAKRFGIDKETIFDLFFYTLVVGIIGARFYYVLFNFEMYSNDILSIFKFWEGGLAIHGGILFGLITMYFYCKKKNLTFLRMTDIVAPFLLLAQSIGRWGNFFNSEAHGSATTWSILKSHFIPEFVINGMNIHGIYYEPTFYYESLWCLLGVLVLLFLRRRKWLKVGTLTCMYFIWYGLGRFFIEKMRTDSLMLGGFKMAQLVSILMIVGGIIGIVYLSKKEKYEDLYNE